MKNSDSNPPRTGHDEESSSARRFNARLGLALFAVYLLMYLIYVLINAFAADVMETIALAGLNLAIVYGFGLIIAALVLALIYGMLCRNEPIESSRPGEDLK